MKTTLTKNSPLDLFNSNIKNIFIAMMSKPMREEGMTINISNEIGNSMIDKIVSSAAVDSDIVIANELAADVLCMLDEQYPNGVEQAIDAGEDRPEKLKELDAHLNKMCNMN